MAVVVDFVATILRLITRTLFQRLWCKFEQIDLATVEPKERTHTHTHTHIFYTKNDDGCKEGKKERVEKQSYYIQRGIRERERRVKCACVHLVAVCVCAYSALRVPQGYVDGKWYCDVCGRNGGRGGGGATRLGASKAFNKEMALRLVLSGK